MRTTDNSNQLDIGDINLQPSFVQAQSTVNVTIFVIKAIMSSMPKPFRTRRPTTMAENNFKFQLDDN
jgi:hypothetical protein